MNPHHKPEVPAEQFESSTAESNIAEKIEQHAHARGEHPLIYHIDDAGYFTPGTEPLSEASMAQVIEDVTTAAHAAASVDTAVQRHPYPFRPYYRKGTDKKTGKPIYEATLPPTPVNYQADKRPMTTKEVAEAAERLGLASTNKRFTGILRYVMMRSGYRLGLLPI
jgi:hypothetical protein